MQVQSVLTDVDEALQLLHSQVNFLSLPLTAPPIFTNSSPVFFWFFLIFPKCELTVFQLNRTIVSVALWDGENDRFHNK